MWIATHRNDKKAAEIADRHYSRVTPGARGFVSPAKSIVLVTAEYDALWVSLWPRPEYVRLELNHAYQCTLFRNESHHLSSDMIRDAMTLTESIWGPPPVHGWITMVNPARVRHKRDPGRCFRKCGFRYAGLTKKGLVILQCDRKTGKYQYPC